MARKHREKIPEWYKPPQEVICPICGRDIPEDQRDEHHLIPKAGAAR